MHFAHLGDSARRAPQNSHNRLFGQSERPPITPSKNNTFKSNLPFINKDDEIAKNGNGHLANGNGHHAATNGNGVAHTNGKANGFANGHANGNDHHDGVQNGHTNGHKSGNILYYK